MENIWVKESYFSKAPRKNEDGEGDFERSFMGDSKWHESFTDDKSKLFRNCQKEFGGCTSKIYLNIPMGDGTYDTRDGLGWVFEKRTKYEDCNETYIQEVWCEISIIRPKSVVA
jgi:hypothetical protein